MGYRLAGRAFIGVLEMTIDDTQKCSEALGQVYKSTLGSRKGGKDENSRSSRTISIADVNPDSSIVFEMRNLHYGLIVCRDWFALHVAGTESGGSSLSGGYETTCRNDLRGMKSIRRRQKSRNNGGAASNDVLIVPFFAVENGMRPRPTYVLLCIGSSHGNFGKFKSV